MNKALSLPPPSPSAKATPPEQESGEESSPHKPRALLICPSARPTVGFLAERMPLSNVPILGESLVEYWLSHLAGSGIKEVLILSCDRPEEVGSLAGNGARWGLTVQVQALPMEFSPSDSIFKYPEAPGNIPDLCAGQGPEKSALHGHEICVAEMDHLPGLRGHPMLGSYRDWYEAVCAWMPHATRPERVGVRATGSGIWMSLQSRILAKDLRPPCWIGRNVYVGENAVIGPGTVLEEGTFVEAGAVVSQGYVGPHTYVGRDTVLNQALAWGDTLVNWNTGALTRVRDAFILSSLKSSGLLRPVAAIFGRIASFYSRPAEEPTIGAGLK
jgi:hypothetical protein